LVTTTCYIISRNECSKKKKKGKGYEEIKRSKCPEPRKKRKSETRCKNGQVSDSRIRGTKYPPKRKEKENVEHLILLKKYQKSKNGKYPLKRAKSRIRLSPFLSPSSPYTIHFATHAHLDLTY